MALRDLAAPVDRHLVEFVLALFVLVLLALLSVVDISGLESLGTVLGVIIAPATIFAPGLLALSVLLGVLAHVWRIGVSWSDQEDHTQPGDTTATRLVASLVLGLVAIHTLWWVVGTLYVLYLADGGGVLIAPLFALFSGSILAVLVLMRSAVSQDDPASRLRDLFGV